MLFTVLLRLSNILKYLAVIVLYVVYHLLHLLTTSSTCLPPWQPGTKWPVCVDVPLSSIHQNKSVSTTCLAWLTTDFLQWRPCTTDESLVVPERQVSINCPLTAQRLFKIWSLTIERCVDCIVNAILSFGVCLCIKTMTIICVNCSIYNVNYNLLDHKL